MTVLLLAIIAGVLLFGAAAVLSVMGGVLAIVGLFFGGVAIFLAFFAEPQKPFSMSTSDLLTSCLKQARADQAAVQDVSERIVSADARGTLRQAKLEVIVPPYKTQDRRTVWCDVRISDRMETLEAARLSQDAWR